MAGGFGAGGLEALGLGGQGGGLGPAFGPQGSDARLVPPQFLGQPRQPLFRRTTASGRILGLTFRGQGSGAGFQRLGLAGGQGGFPLLTPGGVGAVRQIAQPVEETGTRRITRALAGGKAKHQQKHQRQGAAHLQLRGTPANARASASALRRISRSAAVIASASAVPR